MIGEWSAFDMLQMNRRLFLATSIAGLGAVALPAFAATPVFYRSPGCGCCHVWTERMAAAGLPVALEDSEDLSAVSDKFGVPGNLQGCHVGEMEGYVISGHVPPDDIKRLLQEKPQARGLVVPGMPVGSPGMEMGDQTEPYDVLLLMADGSTTVFASHA
jgi:hypothetical protein